jgi:translation initiation factor IF-3
VPVPRRFDRRPPERDTTRINDRIRVPEVRLVGEDGKQIGVIKTSDALAYAQERDLDLVEVAPDARPPVCRVLDYSKYKYEQAQKQKAARKHQQQITIREIKFRPKIAQNDYDTKKGHVRRFLLGRDRVKVTIMFRGREVTHPERGTALLDRLAEELSEIAIVEQTPLQDGRNMTMMLAPSKAVLAGEIEGAKAEPSDGDGHGSSRRERARANGAADVDAAAEVDADAKVDAAAEVDADAKVDADAEAEGTGEADGTAEPEGTAELEGTAEAEAADVTPEAASAPSDAGA